MLKEFNDVINMDSYLDVITDPITDFHKGSRLIYIIF